MKRKIFNTLASLLLTLMSSLSFTADCVDPELEKALSTILASAQKLEIDNVTDAIDLVEFTNLPITQLTDASQKIDRLAEIKHVVGVTATLLRNSPGTVSVSRTLFDSPKLLRGKLGNAGLIPREIGDILAGENFSSFSQFRGKFWQVISGSKYADDFKASNRTLMAGGNSPFVLPEQRWAGRERYELHHIEPINQGGDVYDLSNLMIVTPRFHDEVLDRIYHYGN